MTELTRGLSDKDLQNMAQELREAFALAAKNCKQAKTWGFESTIVATHAIGQVASALLALDATVEARIEKAEKAESALTKPRLTSQKNP